MENGVKLFNDKNYSAAEVEFRAAYDARPNANPLVNVALCEKALFRYPQAIATLEAALSTHGATMDPADVKAAGDAIKEMRGLLGTVTLTIAPKNAVVLLDGEPVANDAGNGRISLGPGTHKIEARAEGYSSAQQSVTVASGEERHVDLSLPALSGTVTVEAADLRMTVAVDHVALGSGRWTGKLPPGPHVVQTFGTGGRPYTAQVLVVPGETVTVRPGATPNSPPQLLVGDVPQPPPLPREESPPRRGAYVLVLGSILFPLTHPEWFARPSTDFGAGYGIRLGFQVNRLAGFDLSYEHSSIFTNSRLDPDTSYRTVTERLSAALRLTSPGRTLRVIGAIGGGGAYDAITYSTNRRTSVSQSVCSLADKTWCPLETNPRGVDVFAQVEAGLELDIDHVLIDLSCQAQFEATGGLSARLSETTAPVGLYGALPIINVGPALRIGYRFW